MKLMVTGASGYLAGALVPRAARRAEVFGLARDAARVVAPAVPLAVDLTRWAALEAAVVQCRPDAIIHAAACNPGEGPPERMQAVNEVAARHVAEVAHRVGARLVAVSTDVLFDGCNAPYADAAEASPLSSNAYAVTKANGEQAVREQCPSAVIVRTSLIYGTDRMDRGTAGFVARLASNEKLRLYTDVLRQPVHDLALADALLRLAFDLPDVTGFVNLAGSEVWSRHDFARRMLAHWQVDCEDRIDAVSGVGVAGLPLDCRLSLERAQALGLATPGVSAVLAAGLPGGGDRSV